MSPNPEGHLQVEATYLCQRLQLATLAVTETCSSGGTIEDVGPQNHQHLYTQLLLVLRIPFGSCEHLAYEHVKHKYQLHIQQWKPGQQYIESTQRAHPQVVLTALPYCELCPNARS